MGAAGPHSEAVYSLIYQASCFIMPVGIWLSPASGKNLLVLDVEGTDGRERGEDQARTSWSLGFVCLLPSLANVLVC